MAPATAPSASKGNSAQHLLDTTRRRDIWNALLGLRIVNALTLWTFFQPDEFYQALEPAWQLAFGKGVKAWNDGAHDGPWITWEWRNQLRSSMYPMLYAAVYKVFGTLSDLLLPPVSRTKILIFAPKAIQAVGAAAMDFYTFKLAGRVYGENSNEAWATLGLAVLSPWQWFVSTRSMSNCLETTLTVIALYFWPWEWVKASTDKKAREKDTSNLKYCVILAGLASVLRPTNALIWACLALFTFPRATQREFFALVNTASTWGSAVLVLSMSADYLYYGEVTFPPMNFIKQNLGNDISSFYGVNRTDYYFTEGIPLLLMTALPFAITGLSQAITGRFLTLPADTQGAAPNPSVLRSLAVVAVALPVALSFVAHKEVRFIYPILPILFVIISRPVIAFFHPFPNPASAVRKGLLLSLVGINVIIAVYLGFYHNRGVMGAIGFVRLEHERANPGMVDAGITEGINVTTVAVLMPCHSTPWRSHLVYPDINIWALTCEPPVHNFAEDEVVEEDEYEDETANFYEDVDRWIRLEMGTQKRAWPDYIIMHESLSTKIKPMVAKYAFELGWSGFNSLLNADPRRRGNVEVWVKTLPYGGVGKADDPIQTLPYDEDEEDEFMKLIKTEMDKLPDRTGQQGWGEKPAQGPPPQNMAEGAEKAREAWAAE